MGGRVLEARGRTGSLRLVGRVLRARGGDWGGRALGGGSSGRVAGRGFLGLVEQVLGGGSSRRGRDRVPWSFGGGSWGAWNGGVGRPVLGTWGGTWVLGARGAGPRGAGRRLGAGPRGGARGVPSSSRARPLESRGARPAQLGPPHSERRGGRASAASGWVGAWAGARAGAGGAAPSILLQPLERGAGAKARLRGAGTMNRSFHKSQTLRFYDCSAVEVKSKVSRRPRSAPPRMNGRPAGGGWALRGVRGLAATLERGRRGGMCGGPAALPVPARTQSPAARWVPLEPGAGRAARAPDPRGSGSFVPRAGDDPARRTVEGRRFRGDPRAAPSGAVGDPGGPGPGGGPGRASSFAAEEPRNPRGVSGSRPGPPAPPARPRPRLSRRARPAAPPAARAPARACPNLRCLCAFG